MVRRVTASGRHRMRARTGGGEGGGGGASVHCQARAAQSLRHPAARRRPESIFSTVRGSALSLSVIRLLTMCSPVVCLMSVYR
jgi:hypothetical protein